MSSKGKVDTCASSTRGVGTFNYLVAIFLWATCIRMLQFAVVDGLTARSLLPGALFFLGLATFSAVLGVGWLRHMRVGRRS